jgi:hypothetical protein
MSLLEFDCYYRASRAVVRSLIVSIHNTRGHFPHSQEVDMYSRRSPLLLSTGGSGAAAEEERQVTVFGEEGVECGAVERAESVRKTLRIPPMLTPE